MVAFDRAMIELPTGRHARRRPWTGRDCFYLQAWWGLRPDAVVAAHLGRTVNACKIRATRFLHQSRSANLLTASELARIFAVDPTTLSRLWLRRGWIVGRHSTVSAGGGRTGARYRWTFSEESLARFVRERPWCVAPDRMAPDHWLTDLAREVHAADPWLTLDAAAAQLGYCPPILARWVHRLDWPHERAPRFGQRAGPWQGRLVLRAATLPDLARAIEDVTHAHRSAAARARTARSSSSPAAPTAATGGEPT